MNIYFGEFEYLESPYVYHKSTGKLDDDFIHTVKWLVERLKDGDKLNFITPYTHIRNELRDKKLFEGGYTCRTEKGFEFVKANVPLLFFRDINMPDIKDTLTDGLYHANLYNEYKWYENPDRMNILIINGVSHEKNINNDMLVSIVGAIGDIETNDKIYDIEKTIKAYDEKKELKYNSSLYSVIRNSAGNCEIQIRIGLGSGAKRILGFSLNNNDVKVEIQKDQIEAMINLKIEEKKPQLHYVYFNGDTHLYISHKKNNVMIMVIKGKERDLVLGDYNIEQKKWEDAGEFARVATNSDFYRYMTIRELIALQTYDRIDSSLFRRKVNREGYFCFTDQEYSNPIEAKKILALPTAPSYRVRFWIVTDGLKAKKRRVEERYGEEGGGVEYVFPAHTAFEMEIKEVESLSDEK